MYMNTKKFKHNKKNYITKKKKLKIKHKTINKQNK